VGGWGEGGGEWGEELCVCVGGGGGGEEEAGRSQKQDFDVWNSLF
jgi:hypothetical protein